EDAAVGQSGVDAAARGEAGRTPKEFARLDVAHIESADGDGERVTRRERHRAAGVRLAAQLPGLGVVLAVIEPDLDAVAAVAAHDQKILANAEARVAGGGALPDRLAVRFGDAMQALVVEQQTVAEHDGVGGAE